MDIAIRWSAMPLGLGLINNRTTNKLNYQLVANTMLSDREHAIQTAVQTILCSSIY